VNHIEQGLNLTRRTNAGTTGRHMAIVSESLNKHR
jgi:hypothetical protein